MYNELPEDYFRRPPFVAYETDNQAVCSSDVLTKVKALQSLHAVAAKTAYGQHTAWMTLQEVKGTGAQEIAEHRFNIEYERCEEAQFAFSQAWEENIDAQMAFFQLEALRASAQGMFGLYGYSPDN